MNKTEVIKLPVGSVLYINDSLYCICLDIDNCKYIQHCNGPGWFYWDEISKHDDVELLFKPEVL